MRRRSWLPRQARNARAAGACCRRWASSRTIRRCASAAPMRWNPGWCAEQAERRESADDMSRNALTLVGFVTALVVLGADQLSKWWILEVARLPEVGQIVLLPVLNLTMVWNRGVTFGLLTGSGQWSYLL